VHKKANKPHTHAHPSREEAREQETRQPDDACTFFLLPYFAFLSRFSENHNTSTEPISLPICALDFQKARAKSRK